MRANRNVARTEANENLNTHIPPSRGDNLPSDFLQLPNARCHPARAIGCIYLIFLHTRKLSATVFGHSFSAIAERLPQLQRAPVRAVCPQGPVQSTRFRYHHPIPDCGEKWHSCIIMCRAVREKSTKVGRRQAGKDRSKGHIAGCC